MISMIYMYMYIYYIYVYIYVYIYSFTYIWIHACIYVGIYRICPVQKEEGVQYLISMIYICTYIIYMYIYYIYVYIYVYIFLCIHLNTCMHICRDISNLSSPEGRRSAVLDFNDKERLGSNGRERGRYMYILCVFMNIFNYIYACMYMYVHIHVLYIEVYLYIYILNNSAIKLHL
jgi:hypothetical protein